MELEKRIKDSLLREAKRKLSRVPWADASFCPVRKPTQPSQDIRLARRFARFQDGTRKARKNTVIPCKSIGTRATRSGAWGIFQALVRKPECRLANIFRAGAGCVLWPGQEKRQGLPSTTRFSALVLAAHGRW